MLPTRPAYICPVAGLEYAAAPFYADIDERHFLLSDNSEC